MKLPLEILKKVSWYEYSNFTESYEHFDRIVLHWKSWFKRSKTLDFKLISRYNTTEKTTEFFQHGEFKELKSQLEKHFEDKPELTEGQSLE